MFVLFAAVFAACDIEKLGDLTDLGGVDAKVWCKTLRSTSTNSYDDSTTVTEYSWDGNTVDWSSAGMATTTTYNDLGYAVDSVTDYNDGNVAYTSTSETEYDCDLRWCKTLSSTVYNSYSDTTTVTEYSWDGNTADWGSEVSAGTSTHNDQGYALTTDTSYDDGTTAYTTSTETDYDCGLQWCKVLRYETYTSLDGSTTVHQNSWDGNTASWSTDTTDSVVTYNDYGYAVDVRSEYDDGNIAYVSTSTTEYSCN